MKKKKRIRDLEERVRSLEEYVDNRRIEELRELRAAMRQAEFSARMKDPDPGTTTTKNPTLPFSPC